MVCHTVPRCYDKISCAICFEVIASKHAGSKRHHGNVLKINLKILSFLPITPAIKSLNKYNWW